MLIHYIWRRGETGKLPAMAAVHGSLSEFKPGKEDWNTYTEKLGYYFLANKIDDDELKRSILLAACGSTTLRLIKSLTKLDLKTLPYATIVKLVQDYYEPQISSIVQRFKFNTRERESTETVAAYVAALRELAERCKYERTLPDMLRDHLVCGVNHQIIQKKLLGEKDLTFDKAFALAQSIELAERDAKKLKNGSSSHPQPQVFYNKSKAYHYSSPSTNTVKREREVSKQIECYRCGRDHLAPACTLNPDTVCSYCKKTGHLARVCRSKRKDQSQQKGTQPKRNLYLSGDDVPSVDAYDMFSLQDGGSEPIRIQVSLNNVPTDMVLDTGASLSIISQSTYRELQSHGPTASLEPSTARLQTYTGEVIPVVGTA